MEIWDAYDAEFNKLENKTLIRGEVIPDGLFHLVCEILVKHSDELATTRVQKFMDELK